MAENSIENDKAKTFTIAMPADLYVRVVEYHNSFEIEGLKPPFNRVLLRVIEKGLESLGV